MKQKWNPLRRILIVSMSLLMCASALFGCNTQTNNSTENPGYQAYAGVDMDSPISKFVVNNQSSYKIVIPTEASECEEYSASELQDFVKQATGVKIEIVSDKSVKLGDRCISLGNTSLYKESVFVNLALFCLHGKTLFLKTGNHVLEALVVTANIFPCFLDDIIGKA